MEKDKVRIVVISDTHEVEGWENQVQDGDILIHCGDFTMLGMKKEVESFKSKLLLLPHKHKIVIAGNHELTFDTEMMTIKRQEVNERFKSMKNVNNLEVKKIISECPHIHYLENSGVEVEGIRIWGSPYQPKFYFWGFQKGDQILPQIWQQIPTGVDILVTHGPPSGVRDPDSELNPKGSKSLLEEVTKRVKPKLHVFGHLHEGYGWEEKEGILFVNASTCDESYTATHPSIAIDMDLKTKTPTVAGAKAKEFEFL